ncbi:MAG TPA: RNA polymerase sigma factor, partial [Polyangiaceae bacterium]|nr:RNA polymerase sigma factor [Polyangiaceae bacterium]
MVSFLAAHERDCPPVDARVRERRLRLADFEGVYRQHVDFVRRVLVRLLGSVQTDVDDAVQEVFLIAFRKRDEYEGRAEPSTWLCAIARRVAMSARRRARLRTFWGLDAAYELRRDRTPLELFEDQEATKQLYSLLDRLPEKKRTVWILHELEELPGEAIAQIV